MKKLLISLICLLNLFSFSAAENIIFESTYAKSNVSSIFCDLSCEKIEVESYFGDEVSLQISSNNLKLCPKITLENNQLKIKSTISRNLTGEYCNIKLYVPEDSELKNLIVTSLSGALILENITVLSEISGKSYSGSIKANNLSCEDLTLSTISGSITTELNKVDFFDINSTSGSISISLKNNFSALSQIQNVSGSISLFLPKSPCLKIEANTNSGNITDDLNKNNLFSKTKYESNYGTDGATLKINTVSGKIRIKSL